MLRLFSLVETVADAQHGTVNHGLPALGVFGVLGLEFPELFPNLFDTLLPLLQPTVDPFADFGTEGGFGFSNFFRGLCRLQSSHFGLQGVGTARSIGWAVLHETLPQCLPEGFRILLAEPSHLFELLRTAFLHPAQVAFCRWQ
jgi:hypothetical protein